MATPNNYYQDITDPRQAMEEIPKRIAVVLETSEKLRREINRIRNTALGFQIPIRPSMLALLAHLQVDLAHARVELGYMLGLQGEEFQKMVDMLANPHARLGNED